MDAKKTAQTSKCVVVSKSANSKLDALSFINKKIFTADEIYADDWEVLREKIEITKEQLERALVKVTAGNTDSEFVKKLAKEIGFTE